MISATNLWEHYTWIEIRIDVSLGKGKEGTYLEFVDDGVAHLSSFTDL